MTQYIIDALQSRPRRSQPSAHRLHATLWRNAAGPRRATIRSILNDFLKVVHTFPDLGSMIRTEAVVARMRARRCRAARSC